MALFLLWLTRVLSAEIPEDKGVLVLNETNFQAAIDSIPGLLVEFYAPWCTFCLALAPEYESAARRLSKYDPPIRIAKIDATENTSLSAYYEVTGFPTLKYFEKAVAKPFEGGRKTDGIVHWLVERAGPAVLVVTDLSEFKKMLENYDISIIGFSKDQSSFLEQISNKVRGPNYAICTDSRCLKEYAVKEDSIILLKNFDEKRNDFEGEANLESVMKFIEKNRYPSVLPQDDFVKFTYKNKVNMMVFIVPAEESSKYHEIASKFGKNLKGTLVIGFSDSAHRDFSVISRMFAVSKSETPTAVIYEPQEKALYQLKETFSEESIEKFIDDWKNGKLIIEQKSEPIPDDPYENGIRVLVWKNLWNVLETNKFTLVKFCTAWSSKCKDLEKDYLKIAEKFKGKVDVSKYNAINNHMGGIELKGFPTIRLFSPQDKKGIFYDGELNFEGLEAFLNRNLNEKADL